MTDQWYYMHKGRECGPVSTEQLKQLVAAGQLRASDEVWKQGTPDWGPVHAVPDLAHALPASDAAPAPRPDRPPSDPPSAASPAAAAAAETKGCVLWNSFVRYGKQSGEYLVILAPDGIKASPLEIDGKAPPGAPPFSVPWSEVRSAEQRYGFLHWGIIFHLASSAERCEVWVLYEHASPSVFDGIKEQFSGRIGFRPRAIPVWKVMAAPLALATVCGAAGIWVYQCVAQAEAAGEDLGEVHWIIRAFGSGGVAAVFGFTVLISLVYALWLARRTRRS
jgi:hypothetical protein